MKNKDILFLQVQAHTLLVSGDYIKLTNQSRRVSKSYYCGDRVVCANKKLKSYNEQMIFVTALQSSKTKGNYLVLNSQGEPRVVSHLRKA